MFREIRRRRQALPIEAAEEMLIRGMTGVLAVLGDGDYPYAVPLNYVYHESAIFFHCARTGHKIDAIRGHGKVSFCVVDKDRTVPELFASDYRSAIAFGRAQEVDDDDEKLHAMRLLNEKYAPGLREEGEREIGKDWKALCVIRIDVEHLSGKEAAESVKGRA
ncbi:MAG: pyridoxamine 5'-phosphate oxidase family protein [Euryarchaeota archaeon]|nr:pyridoxamine 5'-phosphate oxidase family protein [Euryarchaeota archaeon]